ncbi:MAG: hypothetical protein IT305_28980 [Chloroflexi bacterium]|nr:hypothetical protein [Chloroflexota bacterium]
MQNDPATRVSAPAVGLIVTGALGAVTSLGLAVVAAVGGVAAFVGSAAAETFPVEALPGVAAFGIVVLIGLVASLFTVYAGFQMRSLRGWGMSLAGAIVAAVPCLSPCCILGLPIGIWAILVLIDEPVKQAFADRP